MIKRTKTGVPYSPIAMGLGAPRAAISEPNYTVWGASPMLGPDGKAHLFCARWPESKVNPHWKKSSEIAHYVADTPAGPFRFSEVVAKGSGVDGWDKYAPHNPNIQKVGDKYVLTYIANSNYRKPPFPSNQTIGMKVAESLDGPLEKVGVDGLVLAPPEDPAVWCHKSFVGVNNPALLAHPDGRFLLYFNSTGTDKIRRYGVAVAERLEGPYVHRMDPITANKGVIEDGYAFMWRGKVCLISTDNHGSVTGIRGAGVLWVSDDGLTFDIANAQLAFEHIVKYVEDLDPKKATQVKGREPKFERPAVLLIDGAPAYFYAPSCMNIYGGKRTVSNVLKIDLPDGAGPLSAIRAAAEQRR